MDQKILIIEDNEITCELVGLALGKKFTTYVVHTTNDAMVYLNNQSCDLIILDVELPGENGFHFCAKLRNDERYKHIQIVFLTGKNTTADKILGFSLGADDYITKPFDREELYARVIAKMRRIEEQKTKEQIAVKGIFSINYSKQIVTISDINKQMDLNLTSIEFKLLSYFLNHEDYVLSRNQILNHIWGVEVHISDRTVDSHIYSLRKKLGSYSTCIKSIKNEGYRFNQKNLLRKIS